MEVEEIFAPYKVFHSFHINYLNQNVFVDITLCICRHYKMYLSTLQNVSFQIKVLPSFHINQDHHAVVHLEQGVAVMLKTVTN